jgi:hypothetical protein
MTMWTPVTFETSARPSGSGFSPPQESSTTVLPPTSRRRRTSSIATATSWSWKFLGASISP